MRLTSPAFEDGATLPLHQTCDGDGISPPLAWSDVPDGTQSFAIICDDPDAPRGVFTHWVLFNLTAGARELAEQVPPQEVLSIRARQGRNDFNRIGYGAACPPAGDPPHRYVFKLYALDTVLALEPGGRKEQLLDAMRGHVLAEAQLTARYKR